MKEHTHDETDPLAIPAFLCALCNPRPKATAAEIRALERRAQKAREKERAAERRARELHKAKLRLYSLERRRDPVSERIAASLRLKVKRLERMAAL